jgi:hypothetical protein
MKLGDYLKAINHTKKPVMDTDDYFIEKDYMPFIVNRCLSFFPDTIIQANQMNIFPHSDNKMQFDFLQRTIRKKKRYSPWIKETLSEDINTIKEYFNYGNRKAKEALEILTDDDINKIKNKLSRGGKS